jgi:hypothetical protein
MVSTGFQILDMMQRVDGGRVESGLLVYSDSIYSAWVFQAPRYLTSWDW